MESFTNFIILWVPDCWSDLQTIQSRSMVVLRVAEPVGFRWPIVVERRSRWMQSRVRHPLSHSAPRLSWSRWLLEPWCVKLKMRRRYDDDAAPACEICRFLIAASRPCCRFRSADETFNLAKVIFGYLNPTEIEKSIRIFQVCAGDNNSVSSDNIFI